MSKIVSAIVEVAKGLASPSFSSFMLLIPIKTKPGAPKDFKVVAANVNAVGVLSFRNGEPVSCTNPNAFKVITMHAVNSAVARLQSQDLLGPVDLTDGSLLLSNIMVDGRDFEIMTPREHVEKMSAFQTNGKEKAITLLALMSNAYSA